MIKIGSVVNFFEKTEVCVVNLVQDIDISYQIKVIHPLNDSISPKIEFIQIGTKKVNFVKKGQTVIIKFDEKIKPGSEIYKN